MDIPNKCKKCIHRLKDYCRGNQAEIALLNVENCKRAKYKRRWKKKK